MPTPTATAAPSLTRDEVRDRLTRAGGLTVEEALALSNDTSYSVGERTAFEHYANGLISRSELQQRLGFTPAPAPTSQGGGQASTSTGANAGTRVTPGQPLPEGTLVEETARDQSLLPAQQNMDAMRNGSPRSSVTLEINRRWFFQPGAIVPSYGVGARDVVIAYHPEDSNRNWSVDVQEIDRDGRVAGPVRNHSTAPTFGEVVATLPARAAQVDTTVTTAGPTQTAANRIDLNSLRPPRGLTNRQLNWQLRAMRFPNAAMRALYILRPGGRSESVGPAREWLRNVGFTDAQITQLSEAVVSAARAEAARTSGAFTVPEISTSILQPSTQATPQPTQVSSAPDASVNAVESLPVGPAGAAATRAIGGFRRFAQRILRSANLEFRGVNPVGAFATAVNQTATAEERKTKFWEAMQQAIAEFNAAPASSSRWQLNGSVASWTISVNGRNVASGYLSSSGHSSGRLRMGIGSTGFEGTAEQATENSNGARFYDALYGALVAAGIYPELGTLYTPNQARMPLNRLRAMLKYGAAVGNFAYAANILSMGNWVPSDRTERTAGFSGDLINPDAALLDRMNRVTREVFGELPMFNANGTYSIQGRTLTRGEMKQFVRNYPGVTYRSNHGPVVRSSPDQFALVALGNAMAQRGSDHEALAEAFLNTNLAEGAMLFNIEEEVPEVDNTARPERRQSTGSLIEDIRNGVPASASTPGRGLIQAVQAKDKAGVAKALRVLGERLNEELHDASIRMKRWLQTLPETDRLTNLMKQRVIGSMYTARKKRDDVLRRMYDEHLQKIDELVAAFADKHKISIETAMRDIGYVTTAKTIPARNAYLLRKRVKALQELQRQLAEAQAAEEVIAVDPNDPTLTPEAAAAATSAPTAGSTVVELQQQVAAAQRQLAELVAAINNPAINVRKHGGGGVAGMNNAQAADIMSGARERYGEEGFAAIEAIANRIYDMNAAKLALDIESGKVSPQAAAEFLERPAALEAMQQLRDLADTVDAANKASVQALEAKRKEVIAAVRTEYVPLSGDPRKDIDDASFHGGSGIPNVQRDYELQGRERGAPPDDGLSTSRAGLMKSASYYGWRDFQDGIAALHRAMSKEERQAFGIRAEKVEPGRSTLSNKAVIRHRNGKTTAYIFDDESLVDSIRGASRLENNFLLEGAGKVTKAYSYLATQANPFFAPFNFIRDSWERSEFLRTRTYLRGNGSKADSKSIAHGMIKYLADPELLRATARYAMGRPVDVNSRTGRYLDEFLRQGGVSVFSSQFGADRAKMVAQISRQKSWRQQLGTLDRWISTYNKTFDVGPALASYMAMRDQGLTVKDAAAGALDLMDFGKRGKSASIFGSIYAFAQPTFTGAANAITALRDPLSGKWNPVGTARLGGYVVGFLLLQAFLRSLADDDEGGNKLDQQSGFTKNNFLLIPVGEDGMIKVPLAYGLTRVANGIARAALGVGTNEQTPAEATGKLISGSVVPVFSPIEDSDINWFERPAQALLTLFAPSWLKPPLALATNTTPFDSQIINSKYADPTKFKSEQFGKYVPEDYKAMARALRGATGIDMAPEEIRYLFRAYPLGVGQLAVNGVLEGKGVGQAAQAKVYANYSEFARYFQFKQAIDETDDLLKRMKAGEQITDPMERSKLRWRIQWDEQDKELRAAKAKATRQADKAGGKSDAIDGQFADQRMAAQVRALYRYRLMQGKDAAVGEPPVLN